MREGERGRGREEREGEKQGHEMKTFFNNFLILLSCTQVGCHRLLREGFYLTLNQEKVCSITAILHLFSASPSIPLLLSLSSDEVDMKSPIAIDDDLSRTSSAVILESSDTIVRQDSVHTSYDVLPGELGRSERERGGNLVYVCVVVPHVLLFLHS